MQLFKTLVARSGLFVWGFCLKNDNCQNSWHLIFLPTNQGANPYGITDKHKTLPPNHHDVFLSYLGNKFEVNYKWKSELH